MKKKLLRLKNNLIKANYLLFCVFVSLYLILLGLETYQRGFVSYVFNLNVLLGPIFITALILVFSGGSEHEGEIE